MRLGVARAVSEGGIIDGDVEVDRDWVCSFTFQEVGLLVTVTGWLR